MRLVLGQPFGQPIGQNRLKKAEKLHKRGVRGVTADGANFANILNDLWCRGTESNCRHQPFQGCALPTELPRHFGKMLKGFLSTGSSKKNQLLMFDVAERAGFEPATGF
jgi:hypothetical protein